LKKTIQHIAQVPKALYLFLRTCSEKGLGKFRPYYAYGGLSLCWRMACFQLTKVWYNRIVTHYDPLKNQISTSQSQRLLKKCQHQPLISIITSVYKVDAKWLDLSIRSVVNQHYQNWELILVDDGSQRPDLSDLIASWCQKDRRIKSIQLEQNRGIAGATNAGFGQATGEFIGILDHDDELTPDALVWVVWTLNQHPQAKWFYSDEDLITTRGDCHSPFYKPDYSPENLLSRNFICHFRVYAADVLRQIGGKRTGFDGAQDHDLALRYSEVITPDQIVHIPRVLYHWRTIRSSAATSIQAKPKAATAGVRAVSEAFRRRGVLLY
jgi:glycosyltransferase involved in cell wall biosynthesis